MTTRYVTQRERRSNNPSGRSATGQRAVYRAHNGKDSGVLSRDACVLNTVQDVERLIPFGPELDPVLHIARTRCTARLWKDHRATAGIQFDGFGIGETKGQRSQVAALERHSAVLSEAVSVPRHGGSAGGGATTCQQNNQANESRWGAIDQHCSAHFLVCRTWCYSPDAILLVLLYRANHSLSP